MTDLEEAMERIESNPLARNPQDCLTVVAALRESQEKVKALKAKLMKGDQECRHAAMMLRTVATELDGRLGY